MRELEVNFPGREFHNALFQAVPVPILVVDNQLDIWEYNAEAARCLAAKGNDQKRRRIGQALNCTHARANITACGQAAPCSDCTIYWAVRAAAEGQQIRRQWARINIGDDGKPAKTSLQISSAPFVFGQYRLVLLLLEGLGD
jgi:hypothetical protein